MLLGASDVIRTTALQLNIGESNAIGKSTGKMKFRIAFM